ncbi:retrotransposon protein, putative, ty1-copia subclass [Tanacetum coccineum]
MGYSFYYPPENKVIVARNVEFLEKSLISQEASRSSKDLKVIQEEDTHPSKNTSEHHEEDEQKIVEPQNDLTPVRRLTRTRHALDQICLYIDAEEHESGDHNEPAIYKATLSDLEFDKWLEAMNVEMQSMKDNQVCNLVNLSPNAKTVGSKWLFKKKTNMDGNVYTYKSRLVAKGFTQTYAVDYNETSLLLQTLELLYPIARKPILSKAQGAFTLNEVKRVKRFPYASAVGYTIKTKDMFLVYGCDMIRDLRVTCYTDVGYQTDADDTKS